MLSEKCEVAAVVCERCCPWWTACAGEKRVLVPLWGFVEGACVDQPEEHKSHYYYY